MNTLKNHKKYEYIQLLQHYNNVVTVINIFTIDITNNY